MDDLLDELAINLDEIRAIALKITQVSPVDSQYVQIAAESKNIYNVCGYWQSMASAAVQPQGPTITIPIPQPRED